MGVFIKDNETVPLKQNCRVNVMLFFSFFFFSPDDIFLRSFLVCLAHLYLVFSLAVKTL